MAITQKLLMAKAILAGKPVITATQMLESMVSNRLPTRAEATDVANAILDGTDCIMLSAESAMGNYPQEAVEMLAKIAAYTEPRRPRHTLRELHELCDSQPHGSVAETMALVVEHALETVPCAAVFVPTRTGTTARLISRFKPEPWVAAVSHDHDVCQALAFSYGVFSVDVDGYPEDWRAFAQGWVREQGLPGSGVLLLAGPSEHHPHDNHRLEFMTLDA
jgi:pyruvate kinase